MEGMREEGIKQDTYRQAQGPPHPVASRQPEQDQAEQITVILITLNIEPCNIQETVNRASESAQSPKYQMAAAIAHSAKTHESQNKFWPTTEHQYQQQHRKNERESQDDPSDGLNQVQTRKMLLRQELHTDSNCTESLKAETTRMKRKE